MDLVINVTDLRHDGLVTDREPIPNFLLHQVLDRQFEDFQLALGELPLAVRSARNTPSNAPPAAGLGRIAI